MGRDQAEEPRALRGIIDKGLESTSVTFVLAGFQTRGLTMPVNLKRSRDSAGPAPVRRGDPGRDEVCVDQFAERCSGVIAQTCRAATKMQLGRSVRRVPKAAPCSELAYHFKARRSRLTSSRQSTA